MSGGTVRISFDRLAAPLVQTPQGTALGIGGFVHHWSERLAGLRLYLIQGEHRVEAGRVFLQTDLLGPFQAAAGDRLDGGFYASAVFPADPGLHGGPVRIEATLVWRSGGEAILTVGSVDLIRIDPLPDPAGIAGRSVGIAMATYNPDSELFAGQIASIRAQTHADWICVISDDGSAASCRQMIEATIAGDPRFRLLPPGPNLGFYRNFERACAALPSGCAFVAFSDQDDQWLPDRLSRQLDVIAQLPFGCCYSDLEIASRDGETLSGTFWINRKARYGSLAGLLLANVVTGMTILARRDLIARALPFPATPNLTYHDHWIALVAERHRGLRYLGQPLVRYIQHGANHTGALGRWPGVAFITRQALRRIDRFYRVGLRGRKPREALRESSIHHWLVLEPTRLRVLADRLQAAPGLKPARNRAVSRLCRGFGPVAFAASGADWGDHYRRAYAIELGLGAFLGSCVRLLARRGWINGDTPGLPDPLRNA
ncbi:glycosyltransferase [Methylobacterium nigriterrae]|uniref:glycosyltransferase n=1 Tax=Methylobacterium nigriterrae TaxID=3127512 RepID=UPI003013BBCB